MSNTIQPQELRLGNLVLRRQADLETGKYFYNPIHVDIDDIKLLTIRQDQDIYRPIPLTEEILVKCGFEKIGGEYFKKMNALQLIIRFNAGYVYSEISNAVYLGDLLKHLHTLQNFYYTFTSGRELEVKL